MEIKPNITFEEFSKMDLRAGKVLEVTDHHNADKLYVVKVDLGEKQVQLVAGVKLNYTPEELLGKTVIVIANLAPRQLRGVESQGMLLVAKSATLLKHLTVDGGSVEPGSAVS